MKCVGVQSKHHGNHTYDVTSLLAAMTDVRLSIRGHAYLPEIIVFILSQMCVYQLIFKLRSPNIPMACHIV